MSRFYTNFTQHMGSVLLREVVDGKHVSSRVKLRPSLYIRAPEGSAPEYRTIFDEPVAKVDFDTVREARDFLETYKDTKGFDVFGSTSWAYAAMNERYPGSVDFDPKQVCVAFTDIEVKSDQGFPEPKDALWPITSIALSVRGTMHVFTCVDYPGDTSHMAFHKCDDEAELLVKFLEVWNSYPIDVVVGWHIHFFDVPYLVNRIERVLGPDKSKLLSPWGIVNSREVWNNGEDQTVYTIVGISVVDYEQAYIKFRHKPQESYSLNHISHVELKAKKLDYSEYGSLNELYAKNPKKFIDYNVRDVTLMEELDKKLGFLDLIFTIAYYCKITYDDCFGTVKMWEALIHNDLMDRKIVVPARKGGQKLDFEGGYVKDVQAGRHDWLVSFDFDSLYPHLIMALNISPETLVGSIPRLTVDEILDGKLDDYRTQIGDRCVTGSCHLYDKSKQGFFPRIMQHLYDQRKVNKKRSSTAHAAAVLEKDPAKKTALETEYTRYHNLQLAMKYALNSGYGAMSNAYFLWFDMRMAESVTLSGQVAIRWVARDTDAYLRRVTGGKRDTVVAIDTDSIYVRFDELVKKMGLDETDKRGVVKFLDQACDVKMKKVIRASCDSWDRYLNAVPGKLNMKREKISESAIWVAKKKYAQLTWIDEDVRYEEPKMKFTGLEVVKSSTPAACKTRMKEAIKLMLTSTETDLQRYIREFRVEFEKMRFEDVAAISGVNGIKKYTTDEGYVKGTTMHARAAITYNKLLEERGLSNKYPLLQDGDKIKYCQMKVPNTFGEDVFGCGVVLPEELDVAKYIDWDRQFDKVFVKPLKLLMDVIGWSAEKRASLSSFF
jgi:DNA polymerase elongation subunit (family B)